MPISSVPQSLSTTILGESAKADTSLFGKLYSVVANAVNVLRSGQNRPDEGNFVVIPANGSKVTTVVFNKHMIVPRKLHYKLIMLAVLGTSSRGKSGLQ
ncbi:hypothetical protein [Hymenobacter elongatus]|uniref:Uncharacterized protein n=1 Tax=Hymenobacter elongatus TaxID=877208 RepID=A0A4Z0PFL1_9BACT|nr:hypothetical protein [Hymenobacter elongatus]TGE13938.1 hypothetical protein E5J99_18270 [Hymenobacter elongatus]